MFLGWFWPFFLFSLRDINLTLGLLPPRRHVVWRDSVGVESSGSGLKIIVRGYFASEFSLLLRHTDEPQKGRNSCLWLQTRYVLSSFGVLMSCRVNFHVVRSALQYSACRIIYLQEQARLKNHPNVLAAAQPSSRKPKGREHRQRLSETDADPTRRVLKTGLDGKTTQRRSSSLEKRSTVIITSEKDTF